MKLEQIFYGRDMDGYRVLGASIPPAGLTDLAVGLCQSVGTPGFSSHADDDSPFLMQRIVGESVLMACGRTGEPDDMGRGTLVFHVFIAKLADVKTAGVSAAILYDAGMFSVECRKGDLQPVEFDPEAISVFDSPCRLEFPAIVLCKRSDNMKLLAFMGSSIVGTNWSTMSWNLMKSFDVYGLSDTYEVPILPTDINIYDGDGRLLRRAANHVESSLAASRKDSASRKEGTTRRASPLPVIGVVCLLIGAGAGYFLGWACLDKGGADVQEKIIFEIETRVRSEMAKAYELKYRNMERSAKETSSRLEAEIKTLEMRLESSRNQMVSVAGPVFNEEYRIENFSKKMMEEVPQYELAMIKEAGSPRHKKGRMLFKALREYVNFVNKHYPKTQKED